MNQQNEYNNNKLMKNSESQGIAEALLKQKIEEAEKKLGRKPSREEVEYRARKMGYRNEIDRKIVDSVCKNSGVKSNVEDYRNRIKSAMPYVAMRDEFIAKGLAEGRKEQEQELKNKKVKVFING